MTKWNGPSSSGIPVDMSLLAFLGNTERKVPNESKLYSQIQNICCYSKNIYIKVYSS